MAPLDIPDPAQGGRVADAETPDERPAVEKAAEPARSGPAGSATPSDPTDRVDEPQIRRQSERALGGGMLKSMLAASLAANGGVHDGASAGRFASALNVASDAVRQAGPSLAALGRQDAASTLQSLLDGARAVMTARPDLASGGDAPAIDIRDWDTRKADDAREAFCIASLRVVTDSMLYVAGGASLDPTTLLRELSTNLAVHLDRLPPALLPENGSTGGAGFPEFIDTLRALAVQLRK